MLVDGDKDIKVLDPDTFYRLNLQNDITFPVISEGEIQDKSKVDALSQTLAVLQTSWFTAQSISRVVQGLPITELELISLAFSFLNGFTYLLWWNKPVGVGCHVKVPMVLRSRPPSSEDTNFQGWSQTGLPIMVNGQTYTTTSPRPNTPEVCVSRDITEAYELEDSPSYTAPPMGPSSLQIQGIIDTDSEKNKRNGSSLISTTLADIHCE